MSFTERVPGKIIQSGYEWKIRIAVGSGLNLYPAGATFRAQVRRAPEVPEILYEMTTANDGVKRIDQNTLELTIPGSVSKDWPSRKAFIDIVRTDITPPVHLGFRIAVPVQQPITRF